LNAVTEYAWDDWLDTCELAARAGGQKLLALRGQFKTRAKAPADLVTDADLASQEAIREVIAERYPSHAFIGEEQAADTRQTNNSRLAWIVDPLDGTTNYVHDYPHYAVSVALADTGNILVGAVYNPVADECFAAAYRRGAFCNGVRLTASSVTTVPGALAAVSLPARVERESPDLLDFIRATQACQALRRSGSAALNFAYLAKGALDAFWATHIHPWDVAAGVLLVREAGGVVTARDGSEFDVWNPTFLAAANRELHAGMLTMLRSSDSLWYSGDAHSSC
jgi:myo-inositol-1(or 4)-monophosphatase